MKIEKKEILEKLIWIVGVYGNTGPNKEEDKKVWELTKKLIKEIFPESGV